MDFGLNNTTCILENFKHVKCSSDSKNFMEALVKTFYKDLIEATAHQWKLDFINNEIELVTKDIKDIETKLYVLTDTNELINNTIKMEAYNVYLTILKNML